MKSFLNFTSLMVLMTIAQTANAQSVMSDLQTLGNASWGNRGGSGSTVGTSGNNTPVVTGPAVEANTACAIDDQTSVPYRGLLDLLENKALNISHNSDTGDVVIDGGRMVSNCNSMLKTRVEPPTNGRPYLFHVEIKKPATGCDPETKLCKYMVDVANDPSAPGIKSGQEEIEVAPTFFGFMECLKKTEVLVDGQFNEAKMVKSKFVHRQSGLTQTNDLAFYSKGPLTDELTPRFEGLSGLSGGSCDRFEKIANDGFKIYSQEDVRVARKEVLFDEICAGGDYKAIDRHLPDFEEFDSMYGILRNVRDSYLLDEVKSLHDELKANDYTQLDAEKFKNTLADFHSKIITPLKDDIASLYGELRRARSAEAKANIQKELDAKIAKLVAYNKAPYVNSADLESMKSFAKKAPLGKKAWRDAAIAVYKSNNSAFHYGRYASGSDLPMISVSAADGEIAGDVQVEADYINQLGVLANNPEKSFAREYSSQALSLQRSQGENQQALQQFLQSEQQYVQDHCLNPRKYWINRQRCVQESQENMQAATSAINQYNQALTPEIQRYNNLSTQWAQIEQVRASGQGVQGNPRDVRNQNQNALYNFSFDPGNFQGQRQQSPGIINNPQNQNQAGPFAQQYGIYNQQGQLQQNQGGFSQQYMQYLQQQQNQGRYPTNQFSPSGLPQGQNYGPGVYPSVPAPGQFPPNYFQGQQGQQQFPAFQQQYQGGAGAGFQYQFSR